MPQTRLVRWAENGQSGARCGDGVAVLLVVVRQLRRSAAAARGEHPVILLACTCCGMTGTSGHVASQTGAQHCLRCYCTWCCAHDVWNDCTSSCIAKVVHLN